jgi:hypothetical protein
MFDITLDVKTVQIISSILGLIGGVILAFSLNRVLSEVNLAIDALSTSVQSIARPDGNMYVFTGLDERLKTANRISNSWVRAGIYCLVASAITAAWSIFIS